MNDQILPYICRALDSVAGNATPVYTYVADDMTNATQSATGYLSLKAGFIYRKDKVVPVGSNYSPYPYSDNEYNHRMRIQAFKELSTNEMFMLSLNHFKAKDSSEDQGEAIRIKNVQNLLNTLLYSNLTDPDILIVGDLNAYMDEQPIIKLQNAGFEEQLVRFDPNAYSYIYQSTPGLLDHAMANSSMAGQVTGAAVYHYNTDNYYSRFSDHDTYVVGLNLGQSTPEPPIEDECPSYEFDFRQGLSENGFSTYEQTGNARWNYHTTYGAQITGYNREDIQDQWLISPEIDLSKASSATLTINHQIYYDNGVQGDYTNDQMVWISNTYQDGQDPSQYSWSPLILSQYAVKQYVDATSSIPAKYLTDHVRIAFRYTAQHAADANYWEIKTAAVSTDCQPVIPEGIDQIVNSKSSNRKFIKDGQLLIERDGTGTQVK